MVEIENEVTQIVSLKFLDDFAKRTLVLDKIIWMLLQIEKKREKEKRNAMN